MSATGQREMLEQTIEIYEAHVSAARVPKQVLRVILESPEDRIQSRLAALLSCSHEAAREIRYSPLHSFRSGPVRTVTREIEVLREALAKFAR